jgi:hypothetical protein
MPLPDDSNGDSQEQAYEILEQVTVDYFRADPTAPGPFGFSVLSWKVDGPRGFLVKINGIRVERVGSKAIQPRISQTFHLYAHVSNYYRFLRSVTITVDLSACVPDPNQLVGAYINKGLVEGINADPDLYFRVIGQRDGSGRIHFIESTPETMITAGRIRFILKLRAHADLIPDPNVDIDASFGLSVDIPTVFGGSRLVAVSKTINVLSPWATQRTEREKECAPLLTHW